MVDRRDQILQRSAMADANALGSLRFFRTGGRGDRLRIEVSSISLKTMRQ